ncbi:hypothetical protein [Agathobaculum sp. Marseille-P7918]|uniref:hypothetical protein n=1 Tax=Agathobaculum sp. Marseille-P7918 TaxID=2479843 RepID=UPI000F642AB1|nr:hypothetical protein [Agathobaculum sp. Marseille-P7918]
MQTRRKTTSNPTAAPVQTAQNVQAAPAAADPFAQNMPAQNMGDPAAQAGQQTYPVTVDGEMRQLTLEELIEAASLGLSKQNAYIRRNRAANGMPNGQIYAAFVEEYPDVRPEEIPPQVWEWAQQEGSLVSAYRKWEILTLKDELAALEMNQKNRRAAVGPAQSDGEPAGVDPVTLALLGR